MKVVVVGAGVLGLCVARSLAESGCETALYDRWGVGAGTSSTTFAWVNAHRKHDGPYFRLNVAGMREHQRLASRAVGAHWYVRSGNVVCAGPGDEHHLTANVERLRSLDYAARLVDRREAGRLATGMDLPPDSTTFAYFPDEGFVLPEVMLRSLFDDAVASGVRLRVGEVLAVTETSSGAVVSQAGAEPVLADRVVLATGRWSGEVAFRCGLSLPLTAELCRGSPVVGVIGHITERGRRPERVVHTPDLNLRPAPDGGVVLQAPGLERSVDPHSCPAQDDTLRAEILGRFARLAGRRPPLQLRLGLRALPADGQTVAGFLPGSDRIYGLVTHSGITLGPLLGRLVAGEITRDDGDAVLSPFRPDRFPTSSSTTSTPENQKVNP